MESNLLVNAEIDLPDGVLGDKSSFAPLTRADLWFREVAPDLDIIAQTAGADVWVTLLTDRTGDMIGGYIAGRFMDREAYPWMGGILSGVLGLAAERMLQGAMHRGGYRPLDRIAESVHRSLGRLGLSLAIGDDEHYQDYLALLCCRFDHRDPAVRRACEDATRAMERSTSCGLRARLVGLHVRRFAASKLALYRLTHGDKAVPPRLCADHPAVRKPATEILRLAQDCTRKYGAR